MKRTANQCVPVTCPLGPAPPPNISVRLFFFCLLLARTVTSYVKYCQNGKQTSNGYSYCQLFILVLFLLFSSSLHPLPSPPTLPSHPSPSHPSHPLPPPPSHCSPSLPSLFLSPISLPPLLITCMLILDPSSSFSDWSEIGGREGGREFGGRKCGGSE